MTDLQAAFDAGFEQVKAYVDRLIGAFEARVAALEARAPIPGPPGRDGLPGLNGRDGKDGEPGADGAKLEDFRAHLDQDDRTIVLGFVGKKKTAEHRLPVPWPLYRGVWEPQSYTRGDTVTFAGSTFAAMRDCTADDKPESSDGWKLQVKRGRDAKAKG